MTVRALHLRTLPSSSQQKKIDTTINCCRFVKNHMIKRNIKIYVRRKEHLGYNAMQDLLPVMKGYLPWRKQPHRTSRLFLRTGEGAYHHHQ